MMIFVRQFNASLQNHQLAGNAGKYCEVGVLNFHGGGADPEIKIARGISCSGRMNVQFGGASSRPFTGFKIFGFIYVDVHFSQKIISKKHYCFNDGGIG